MKTCKIITISVYHPTEGHFLKYKLYDLKNGTLNDEFGNRYSAYCRAKELGYNRVYGLKKEDKLDYAIKNVKEI